VCRATAARLVITTKTGEKATVYCKQSRVTAAIGNTHTPVGFVLPGPASPLRHVVANHIRQGVNGRSGDHGTPGGRPEVQGNIVPPAGGGGSTPPQGGTQAPPDNTTPDTGNQNPLGGVIETIKTTVCGVTDQLLGNC
jgi:hypothetical protein